MHNLYGSSEHKDVVKRLRAHLEDWQKQVDDPIRDALTETSRYE